MTYADVIAQMQQIQAQVALFSPQRPTAAASARSAAAFTSALTQATDATAATTTSTAAVGTTGVAAATAATAVDGAVIDAGGVTGDDVVQAAKQYEGVPYVLGGESRSGIDCSGLVQTAFKDLGVSVPRLVHQQETVGQKVDSLKDAKPGDLIVLNGGDHIAIYAGNDTVIHAPYPGRTVSVQKEWFTDADVVSIRRIVPATGDMTTGATTATTATTATDSSGTTSSGLSAATVARATALIAMFGGSGSSGDSSSSSDQSLSSMLASFGITGTTGATDATSAAATAAGLLGSAGTSGTGTSSTTTSSTTTSSTTQQLIAARAAMYGTSV